MRRSIYFFIVLSFLGLLSGILMVFISRSVPPPPAVPYPPPSPPYPHFIAGEGLVESLEEDIYVGTPFSEVVEKVFIQAADKVAAGDPLFKLCDKTIKKQLEVAQGNVDIAVANYRRQLALPRPEDVPPIEALFEQGKVNYENALVKFQFYQNVDNPKAVSMVDFNTAKYASLLAKYQLKQAEGNLALLLAGAWEKDLAIYWAQLQEAKAQLDLVSTNIERYTIRSPVDGTVLRVNIREGEFASAGPNVDPLVNPLMILGGIETLLLRTNIDEEDVWRVINRAEGMAFIRGNSSISFPLNFVRIEPYLVGKAQLTGDITEVVDTRVLQIIYKFPRDDLPVYPGMLVDVYVEAKPNPFYRKANER